MNKNYIPELKVAPEIENALRAIGACFSVFKPEQDNPFENTGEQFNGESFSVHAYDWNEENEQDFNFKWRDFKVCWYKYLGRGMSMNRNLSRNEMQEMVRECILEIMA